MQTRMDNDVCAATFVILSQPEQAERSIGAVEGPLVRVRRK